MAEEDLNKLLTALEKPPALGVANLLQAGLTEEYQGEEIVLTTEIKELIQQFTNIPHIAFPTKVKADLREYQVQGFEWLYKNFKI